MKRYFVTGAVPLIGNVGHCITATDAIEAKNRFKAVQPSAAKRSIVAAPRRVREADIRGVWRGRRFFRAEVAKKS